VANSAGRTISNEARRTARARTFLQARVSYGEGAISAECMVSQLSQTGARLTVASAVALPDVFDIAIPQRAIARRGKLVWREDDQVGIDFVNEGESLPLAGADYPARIKALEAENAKLRAQVAMLMQQVHRLTEE
jgi:PilZ domain